MDESNRFISNSDHDATIRLDSYHFQPFENGPNGVSVLQRFLIAPHLRWSEAYNMGQHRERNLARIGFWYIPKDSRINFFAGLVRGCIDFAEMGQIDRPHEIAMDLHIQTTRLYTSDQGSYT